MIVENITTAFTVSCIVQIFHSLEEIFNHFEKRWSLWKTSRATFVTFEVLFSLLFLYTLLFQPSFYAAFAKAFLLLMFANGVWHLFWGWSDRRYVPGLITAPFHILNSAIYFLS
ncbi:hypothetical protein A2572_04425 [Candidatus Collierbacteria bacterium RIFOXYD1_FULL_40_9]|uniref:HXXEE domain-containing protein n=1 Tax=Candidatus Collierbacteria bacterium RIFOXYD1_FULL_40_9 TaxID=1817731 RepID=A0A1F5FPR1_9BACT|nr:MAG: hypothetical protein A2572_04425 [Candidatus Collierbacteria bacterium RIFOXYD1_FULL_40_9]